MEGDKGLYIELYRDISKIISAIFVVYEWNCWGAGKYKMAIFSSIFSSEVWFYG